MQLTKAKEDISISYISAICAYAGIAYEIIRHDEDSTDGMLMKRITLENGYRFDSQLRIQLKCTSSDSQYTDNGDTLTYKLKAKNFNDLCLPATTPIVLGLLVLPKEEEDWLKWTPDELLVNGCMYWASFEGQEETNNTGTINVKLDKSNVINTETLQGMLEKIAKEENL